MGITYPVPCGYNVMLIHSSKKSSKVIHGSCVKEMGSLIDIWRLWKGYPQRLWKKVQPGAFVEKSTRGYLRVKRVRGNRRTYTQF